MWDLIITLLITISSFLDILIAWVIEQAYNLLMLIADTNIFGEEALEMFSKRIYVLLGVFMLFKLSFSLVNFLIDPDEFYSKEKGGKKLVINVLIVLLLIVSVPTLFDQAYKLQGLLLKNRVIDQVILGVPQPEPKTSEDGDDGSDLFSRDLSFSVFSAFYMPNSEVTSVYKACKNMYSSKELDSTCVSAVGVSAGDDGEKNLKKAFETRQVSKLFSSELLHAKEDGNYIFDYKFFISTITGGIVAVILIGFCIDVAIRTVKLGFLQLIAPIPIISYIDPKSSKSGMFKNWVTNVIKTFLDLFIRLAAVFFAVFIISLLANDEMTTISGGKTLLFSEHPFVKIFIILGALLFAKQVPQLISDITGMKFDTGAFSFNPMKRVAEVPLLGGSLVAGATLGSNLALGGLGAANKLVQAKVLKKFGKDDLANDKMDQIGENFSRRMTHAKKVAGQQFSEAGFMGNKKIADYSVGQNMRKESAKEKEKILKAEKGLKEQQQLYDVGHSSIEKQSTLNNFDDYKAAGYRNSNFINSKLAIKEASDKVKEQKVASVDASNTYQAMVNRLQNMPDKVEREVQVEVAPGKFKTEKQFVDNTEAIEKYRDEVISYRDGEYKKIQEGYDSATKALSSLEQTHKDYIAPQNSHDEKLDVARKVAKGPRPGSF
ncbi:MAG: hypothetical protein PHX03_00750 [Bacilli bacterium]|nr:hypothetical protein [Bacilli bacterium]